MWDQGLVPDVVTHSSSISACAKRDKAVRALKLFQEMRDQGLVPNVITYNALISACAKGDKAVRALELFQEMRDQGLVRSLPLLEAMLHQGRPPARWDPLQRLGQCPRTGYTAAESPAAPRGNAAPRHPAGRDPLQCLS